MADVPTEGPLTSEQAAQVMKKATAVPPPKHIEVARYHGDQRQGSFVQRLSEFDMYALFGEMEPSDDYHYRVKRVAIEATPEQADSARAHSGVAEDATRSVKHCGPLACWSSLQSEWQAILHEWEMMI